MSYDGKLMRRAMVRFEEAKQRRADALHARERAVYAAVPRIAEIDAALRETMSKLISSALRRGTDPRPAIEALKAEVAEVKAKGLALDMARGKPSPSQVDISRPMLDILNADADLHDGNVDCSNYGCFEGIPSARKLAGEFLGCPAEQTVVLGSSSLLIEHDIAGMFWRCGSCGSEPWEAYEAAHDGKKVKFLCPVPGYDRHFGITADLGIENVPVAMTDNGPDMDEVRRLVEGDPAVKGIWCVPKYSNPTGITYSDETVRAFGALKPAAPDFRIFWDNAYCVHDLYDETDELANIFDIAREAGTEDRVVAFASTSKITFPGAGVSAIACSDNSMKYMCKRFSVMIISYDKMNQLRHVRFLKNKDGVLQHMAKHRRRLVPCFDAVKTTFAHELTPCGDIAHWTNPKGGYFISLYVMPGCAKRVAQLCKDCGLTLTGAGAAFPYGIDPQDSHLRIAPTYPSLDEVETASDLLCVCVKLAVIEKLLAEKAE